MNDHEIMEEVRKLLREKGGKMEMGEMVGLLIYITKDHINVISRVLGKMKSAGEVSYDEMVSPVIVSLKNS